MTIRFRKDGNECNLARLSLVPEDFLESLHGGLLESWPQALRELSGPNRF
jgi:hypothetical protein